MILFGKFDTATTIYEFYTIGNFAFCFFHMTWQINFEYVGTFQT